MPLITIIYNISTIASFILNIINSAWPSAHFIILVTCCKGKCIVIIIFFINIIFWSWNVISEYNYKIIITAYLYNRNICIHVISCTYSTYINIIIILIYRGLLTVIINIYLYMYRKYFN